MPQGRAPRGRGLDAPGPPGDEGSVPPGSTPHRPPWSPTRTPRSHRCPPSSRKACSFPVLHSDSNGKDVGCHWIQSLQGPASFSPKGSGRNSLGLGGRRTWSQPITPPPTPAGWQPPARSPRLLAGAGKISLFELNAASFALFHEVHLCFITLH